MTQASSLLVTLSEDLRRLERAAYFAEPLTPEQEAGLIPLVDSARATMRGMAEALEARRR